MKKWATVDCETDPFNGEAVEPFIWAFYDGKAAIIFDEPKTATADFIEHIRMFDGVVLAHNGGKFDFFFPEIIEAIEDNSTMMIINGRLAKAVIGKCELRDSFLCLPVPLAKLAKDDFDYNLLKRENRAEHMEEIRKYVKSDVVNLHAALSVFFEAHGMVLTQASASLKAWEGMGGTVRRYGFDQYGTVKPYYFGGRTQVFQYANGLKGEFKLYDIRSAYPAAMCEEHPLGAVATYINYTDYKQVGIVPYGLYHIKAVSRGCLAHRADDGSVTYHDDNTARWHYTFGHEIQAGLDTKTLTILEGSCMIPTATETLKPYVDRFMADKEKAERAGDMIGRQIAKIFANSCYGKYAADPANYHEYRLGGEPGIEAGWTDYALVPDVIGRRVIRWRPAKNGTYYDLALAASITSLARSILWRAICAAGIDKVYYCDTDSIVCEGTPPIDIGSNLGQWGLDAELSQLWIAGKKMYAFKQKNGEYKTASKGVKATPDQIKRAANGEVVNIKRMSPTMKIDGRQLFVDRRIKIT